jgi:cardiolipin synthase
VRHIPNLLTILRLFATPVIVLQILSRDFRPALILFAAAGLTDTADGTLARRFGWSSRWGALMDPIADKALLMSVFLALGWIGEAPAWLVWMIVARDAAILLVAIWLKSMGKVNEFRPSIYGKLSTLVQLITAGSILLQWPPDRFGFFLAAGALVLWSGFDYAYETYKKLN